MGLQTKALLVGQGFCLAKLRGKIRVREMDSVNHIKSCIIVGAGISGLMAAQKMQDNEVEVTVLEAAPMAGGRVATQRIGKSIFDRGAQYVTTRERVFREIVEGWRSTKLVKPWYVGPLGNQRYVGHNGIDSITEKLAKGLSIKFGETVTKVALNKGKWTVTSQNSAGKNSTHTAEFLVIAIPVPLALDLLESSRVELPYDEEEELRKIKYTKCITVMAQLKGPAGLPNPGAMDLNHPVLRWIGDNSVKGISPVDGSITLNSSTKFAEAHWDSPDETRIPLLLHAAKPFLKADVESATACRWMHSEPTRLYWEKQPFRKIYFLDEHLRLGMCGDGYAGGRIEAAAMSGIALAEVITSPI